MVFDKWPYVLIGGLSRRLASNRLFLRPRKPRPLSPPSSDPTPLKDVPDDPLLIDLESPSSAPALKDRILQGLPLEHSLPSPHYRSGMPDSHSEEPSASPAPISSTQIPPEDSPLEPYIEQIQHQMRHRWRAESALTEPSPHSAHLRPDLLSVVQQAPPARWEVYSPLTDWHDGRPPASKCGPSQQYSPSHRQSPESRNLLWIDHEEEYLDEFPAPPLDSPADQPAHLHVGHQSQIALPHLEGRNLFRIDDTLRPLLSHSYPPSPEDPLPRQRLQRLSSSYLPPLRYSNNKRVVFAYKT